MARVGQTYVATTVTSFRDQIPQFPGGERTNLLPAGAFTNALSTVRDEGLGGAVAEKFAVQLRVGLSGGMTAAQFTELVEPHSNRVLVVEFGAESGAGTRYNWPGQFDRIIEQSGVTWVQFNRYTGFTYGTIPSNQRERFLYILNEPGRTDDDGVEQPDFPDGIVPAQIDGPIMREEGKFNFRVERIDITGPVEVVDTVANTSSEAVKSRYVLRGVASPVDAFTPGFARATVTVDEAAYSLIAAQISVDDPNAALVTLARTIDATS